MRGRARRVPERPAQRHLRRIPCFKKTGRSPRRGLAHQPSGRALARPAGQRYPGTGRVVAALVRFDVRRLLAAVRPAHRTRRRRQGRPNRCRCPPEVSMPVQPARRAADATSCRRCHCRRRGGGLRPGRASAARKCSVARSPLAAIRANAGMRREKASRRDSRAAAGAVRRRVPLMRSSASRHGLPRARRISHGSAATGAALHEPRPRERRRTGPRKYCSRELAVNGFGQCRRSRPRRTRPLLIHHAGRIQPSFGRRSRTDSVEADIAHPDVGR